MPAPTPACLHCAITQAIEHFREDHPDQATERGGLCSGHVITALAAVIADIIADAPPEVRAATLIYAASALQTSINERLAQSAARQGTRH